MSTKLNHWWMRWSYRGFGIFRSWNSGRPGLRKDHCTSKSTFHPARSECLRCDTASTCTHCTLPRSLMSPVSSWKSFRLRWACPAELMCGWVPAVGKNWNDFSTTVLSCTSKCLNCSVGKINLGRFICKHICADRPRKALLTICLFQDTSMHHLSTEVRFKSHWQKANKGDVGAHFTCRWHWNKMIKKKKRC